mgnify:CR=1 FL=1
MSRNTGISASGATLAGRTPVLPGIPVASSMMAPALFTWWFRPVSNAASEIMELTLNDDLLEFYPRLSAASQASPSMLGMPATNAPRSQTSSACSSPPGPRSGRAKRSKRATP